MNKQVKYAIILSILIVLLFAGYAIYQVKNQSSSFIKEVNPNLTEEQRKTFEDRLLEAEKQLQMVSSNEDKYNWTIEEANNHIALGQLSLAKEALENAIKLNGSRVSAYVLMEQVKVNMTDYNGARESILKAIAIRPESADIWKKYIQLEIDHFSADNNTITTLYSDAINKTNNSIDIITVYASWLEGAGNLQAAKEYWLKAIEVNPKNKPAYDAEIKRLDEKLKVQNNENTQK